MLEVYLGEGRNGIIFSVCKEDYSKFILEKFPAILISIDSVLIK